MFSPSPVPPPSLVSHRTPTVSGPTGSTPDLDSTRTPVSGPVPVSNRPTGRTPSTVPTSEPGPVPVSEVVRHNQVLEEVLEDEERRVP